MFHALVHLYRLTASTLSVSCLQRIVCYPLCELSPVWPFRVDWAFMTLTFRAAIFLVVV